MTFTKKHRYLHYNLFFRPLIDDDEDEEFEKFLDELPEEDDAIDVERFIYSDKFIKDHEYDDAHVSSYCANTQ